MPHTRHPAIARGRFEFKTYMVGQVSCPDPNGDDVIRRTGMIPMLLRVIEAGDDMRDCLPETLETDVALTDADLVATVAGYLREGLIDPWTGRGGGRLSPVAVLASPGGLSFVQAVGCLN